MYGSLSQARFFCLPPGQSLWHLASSALETVRGNGMVSSGTERRPRCNQCIASHYGCDRPHPCSRCTNRNLHCTYIPSTVPPHPVGRPRLACDQCVSAGRQNKCSRELPCKQCRRRRIGCAYQEGSRRPTAPPAQKELVQQSHGLQQEIPVCRRH